MQRDGKPGLADFVRCVAASTSLEMTVLDFALLEAPLRPKITRKEGRMETAATMEFLPVVAAPGALRDFLVVSIHDVVPSNRELVDEMITNLGHHGVRVCSLLVVPDYHHQGLFTRDRQFVSWLRDLQADGHEAVIHGYFHERPRRPKESLRDRFLTRVYTNHEGEFYDLAYAEALERITNARDEFRSAGLAPRGFIAPAWLLSEEAERAARDAELEYTTRLHAVRDLRSGEEFASRSIVYSVRASWRRAVSRAWNATLFRLLQSSPLLRISIHPPDYFHPAIWRQIVDLIEATARSRTAITYQDWVAQQRLRRGV